MKLFDDSGVLQTSGGGSGTDSNAVHVNAAGEISGISEKASPVSADIVIIEDSADSNNKKKVQVGNLPVGSVAAADVSVADSDDYFVGTNSETVLAEVGETRHKNGFDLQDEDSNGTISWDDATRTFSIAVKSGESEYYYWIDGKKVTQTTTKSVVVPDTTGAYYIYFADDTGVLTATLESSLTNPVFYEYAIVGLVYWNKTQAKGMCGNERHGYRLSSAAHDKDHHTLGALYASGLDITGLSSGNKTYTQTDSGVFYDEDIRHTVTAETTHPFLYRLGATGEWTLTAASNEVAYKDGGDSYYSWNEWTGSTWQLTEGTNTTDYFMTFFIATPSIGSNSIMKVIGQNAYSSRTKARNAIESELSNLKTNGLPSPEFVFLYVIIAKRDGNLQTLADGSLYVDLRYVKGVGGGSSPASYAADIILDASGFSGNLSSTDTNVQLMAETVDGMSTGATTSDIDSLRDTDMQLFYLIDADAQEADGLMFDNFNDESQVDTTASTNESYDGSGDFYEATTAGGSDIATGGTPSASAETSGREASNAFDDDTSTLLEIPNSSGWLKYDLGSGNDQACQNYTVTAKINNNAYAPKDWTFQGSNDDSTWTTLDTQTGITSWTNGEKKTYAFTNTTSYRYYKIDVTASNTAGYVQIAELEFYPDATRNNLTLISEPRTAATSPTTSRLSVFAEGVDTFTINTDLKGYVSEDDGITWDEATLSEVATVGTGDDDDIKQYSGDETLTTGTGTTMVWKVATLNNKHIKIHACGQRWRT